MSISIHELDKTVAQLTAPGKEILAADESIGTIAKRFKEVNVMCTEATRRDYRKLLFSTPGLGDFISGVILFEETLKQKSAADVALPELLIAQGIVPGIKVDKGTLSPAEFPPVRVGANNRLRHRGLHFQLCHRRHRCGALHHHPEQAR